ncbi:hypothetical protein [Soonwooa sp.]|uniref:hypothetical protein n=1 Tax=Soonwooa sp. TaxID=1938592 RepID=UPI0035B2AD16
MEFLNKVKSLNGYAFIVNFTLESKNIAVGYFNIYSEDITLKAIVKADIKWYGEEPSIMKKEVELIRTCKNMLKVEISTEETSAIEKLIAEKVYADDIFPMKEFSIPDGYRLVPTEIVENFVNHLEWEKITTPTTKQVAKYLNLSPRKIMEDQKRINCPLKRVRPKSEKSHGKEVTYIKASVEQYRNWYVNKF